MGVTYEIADGVLRWALAGQFTGDDVRANRSAIRDDPGFRPGMPVLIDCREMRTLLPAEELRALAAEMFRPPASASERWRYAVLVATDVGFGLARMYGAFVPDPAVDIRPFRDPEEALAWLLSE